MADIIQANIDTVLDLPPDKILEGAKGKLKTVVILGYDHDDDNYFASSTSDSAEILWLLKCCEKVLLE